MLARAAGPKFGLRVITTFLQMICLCQLSRKGMWRRSLLSQKLHPPECCLVFTGASSSAGPATQAAQNLLAGVNEQFGAKKLRKQMERAQKRGAHRSLKFGQLGGQHNALNSSLPPYLRQVGSAEDERSVLVVDSRDQRLASPFQGWLVDEILLNAQAGINIQSDSKLVRSPNTGYHMNLFYMRTLDGRKLIVVGSMTSYGSVPCGKWDSLTGNVLSHKAFQPFQWPMRDDSSTWVDIKLKVEAALLLHLELRGYRSDDDMTVQLNYINDALIIELDEALFIPSCTVTVFQGWRVCAVSFEVGGQLYACSDGGHVVALDFPLCHFEVRVTAISSADSFGLDADRLEFRFKSAGDRLDVSCSTLSVPSTWLVVSRVSGPTLIKNSRWCRDHFARIEGPDQTMQLSQLASIHAHWTAAVVASSAEDTGPRIGAVDVSSHEENYHLTCESPLFRTEKKTVPKEAMALQYHDPATEKATMIVPPIGNAPTVQSAVQVNEQMRSLMGGSSAPGLAITNVQKSEVSLTTPGVAPSIGSQASRAVMAQRRSLEQRQNERAQQWPLMPFVEGSMRWSRCTQVLGVHLVFRSLVKGNRVLRASQKLSARLSPERRRSRSEAIGLWRNLVAHEFLTFRSTFSDNGEVGWHSAPLRSGYEKEVLSREGRSGFASVELFWSPWSIPLCSLFCVVFVGGFPFWGFYLWGSFRGLFQIVQPTGSLNPVPPRSQARADSTAGSNLSSRSCGASEW